MVIKNLVLLRICAMFIIINDTVEVNYHLTLLYFTLTYSILLYLALPQCDVYN